MRYDFTTVLDRRGRDALAVDKIGHPGAPGGPREAFDAIPMWVADMSFPTCPAVTEAIRNRLDHPSFGYFEPPTAYYDAIIAWQRDLGGAEGLLPEHIGYENGVLGGVLSSLGALCPRGDKVLLHSPTYIGFTKALGGAGYRIVHSPLRLDDENVWRMDLQDMERHLKEDHIHAAIL